MTLRTARALAVLNTAVQGAVLGLAQSADDDPRRVRRSWTGVALAVGGGATLAASDLVWTVTTGDRTASADPDGWAAAASRVEQAHARDRTAALELTGRQH